MSSHETANAYFSEIGKIELLTDEESNSLFRSYNNGCNKSKQKLINHNLRLVVKIAKRYEKNNIDKLMDLVSEGNLGLIRAVEKYDVESGNKFSTYAYRWIQFRIEQLFSSNTQAAYVPSHIKKIARKIDSIENTIKKSAFHGDLIAEILKQYNAIAESPLEMKEIARIRELNKSHVSMDMEVNSDDGSSLTIQNLFESNDCVESNVTTKDLGNWVSVKIKNLPENQQKAITSYFGIGTNSDQKVYKEVGEELGCTGSRAQQLVKQGIEGLKRIAERENVELAFV